LVPYIYSYWPCGANPGHTVASAGGAGNLQLVVDLEVITLPDGTHLKSVPAPVAFTNISDSFRSRSVEERLSDEITTPLSRLQTVSAALKKLVRADRGRWMYC
jgi:hypothetical protein